jgi:Arc/MetJ-type ribon-helix-helix transcriptional regulator
MDQTLTLSETLYQQLQTTARNGGFANIEEFIQKLIEIWQAHVQELRRREETVRRIDALRARLLTTYGEMQDSVELIRAGRAR